MEEQKAELETPAPTTTPDANNAVVEPSPVVPQTLTERQFRALRRLHFTVRHDRVEQCGHKLDRMTEPRTNCEYCWWAWFSSHGELVQTADRAFQEQGQDFLDKMRGKKFRLMFLRYMSTLARFQAEAAADAHMEKLKKELTEHGVDLAELAKNPANDPAGVTGWTTEKEVMYGAGNRSDSTENTPDQIGETESSGIIGEDAG